MGESGCMIASVFQYLKKSGTFILYNPPDLERIDNIIIQRDVHQYSQYVFSDKTLNMCVSNATSSSGPHVVSESYMFHTAALYFTLPFTSLASGYPLPSTMGNERWLILWIRSSMTKLLLWRSTRCHFALVPMGELVQGMLVSNSWKEVLAKCGWRKSNFRVAI